LRHLRQARQNFYARLKKLLTFPAFSAILEAEIEGHPLSSWFNYLIATLPQRSQKRLLFFFLFPPPRPVIFEEKKCKTARVPY